MLHTNTLWFEIAIISIVLLLGHICFGHFEERSSRWRKFFKAIATYIIFLSISIYFGREIAFIALGLWLIPIFDILVYLLPKKGINGWTGEPKSKYYEFRGWDKDIFKEK